MKRKQKELPKREHAKMSPQFILKTRFSSLFNIQFSQPAQNLMKDFNFLPPFSALKRRPLRLLAAAALTISHSNFSRIYFSYKKKKDQKPKPLEMKERPLQLQTQGICSLIQIPIISQTTKNVIKRKGKRRSWWGVM